MRILAFSDIKEWEGYKELIEKFNPEIVALPGDLTSDGFASFWSKAIQQIPPYQKELEKENIKFSSRNNNITFYEWIDNKKPKKYKNKDLLDVVESIKKKYKNSKKFLEIRKKIHVDKFYEFLEYAGKKSSVLVVKGDHDEDFDGDYISKKINSIQGCNEISGKLITINRVNFLGLGFNDTHYLKRLKPLIKKFREKVNIIITHSENNKMYLISLFKPQLIIRGHFGSGKYLVNGIPSVFTQGVQYTLIEIKDKKLPKILQYHMSFNHKIKLLKKGSIRPWFSKKSEFELYSWLKAYPE